MSINATTHLDYQRIAADDVEAALSNALDETVVKGAEDGMVYERLGSGLWYGPGLNRPVKTSVLVNDRQDFIVLFAPES